MLTPRAEAPRMPRGYGVPTDGSGGDALPWSWAEQQLTQARNYWICTTHAGGRPHAIPVWGVWLDGAVWFGTNPASAKGRNLKRDPRVVVHLESGDDVVILEGEIELPSDRDALERFVEVYEQKYGQRINVPERNEGIFALRPRIAQTWTEQGFVRNATRWVFDQA
ncbi:MAG TPA: pyridoxamine 5'-phosphate oxidase family protein [Gaiellaceae bacterium]|nr:pyridoxamine 5'-phosphate oxidase family protein [Gaiellaceae bacterium]